MDRMIRTGRDGWNVWTLGMLVAAGVAALLIVLLSGCGASRLAAPTAPPLATRYASPTPNANTTMWQTAIGIGGVKLLGGFTPPAGISPSDGNTGYLCTGSGGKQGNEAVWATHNFAAPGTEHNAGAIWTRLHDLPVAEQDANDCTIVVDTTDPATLVAMIPSAHSGGYTEVSYASFDGGQSWQPLSQQPLLFNGPIATYQGKIYGIVAMSYAQEYVNPNPSALRVSSDQMRTWQTLPSGNLFDAFWLNPGNGALLAHEFNSGQFVTSTDSGQSWHAFVNPMSFNVQPAGYLATTAVQEPVAGQPFMVCGLIGPQAPSAGQPPILSTVCTRDLGQTYTTLPALPDTPAGINNPAGQMRLVGITPDSAVLAMLGINAVPQGPKGSGAVTGLGFALWRLPLGATQWQSLGVPPQFNLSYAPGALVAWPIAGICMAATPDCGMDYVAAYP